MKKILTILLLLTITLSANTERSLKMMKSEQRVALVIGNNSYTSKRLSNLRNPVNDAKAMELKLKSLGFRVNYGENLSVRDMDKQLNNFSKKLRRGGVGLFFFAGHGVEHGGKNYLMGKDSNLVDKEDIAYESLELNKVIDKMRNSGNRLNIVLLDACRNDPFSRSAAGGLAKVDNAKGMFIAYATSPGDVADDGSGKHGVFTEQILSNIDEEGITLNKLFKNVKRDVYNKTNQRQRPWTHDDIIGEFFFKLPNFKSTEIKQQSVQIEYKQPYIEEDSTIKDKYGNNYKTVQSPYTGKIWLDRNLGASRVCKSFNDKACYGDYFQWGRAADGHEKRLSAKTKNVSSSTKPHHTKFIQASVNWLKTRDDNLWQGVDAQNSICPKGFRVPTIYEMINETIKQGMKNSYDVFNSFLKLPSAGCRVNYTGAMYNKGSFGYYWSSSINSSRTYKIYFYDKHITSGSQYRTYGQSVRCIKN